MLLMLTLLHQSDHYKLRHSCLGIIHERFSQSFAIKISPPGTYTPSL